MMAGSTAGRCFRLLLAPWLWLALFLQGKCRRVRVVTLADGSSKKKTVIKQQWPGLRGIWENRHYRIWTGIWLLFVLIFMLIVFGEPLLNMEQNIAQAFIKWGIR